MAKVLLINTADLRGFSDIGVGYDGNLLANAVLKAQEKELRPILGRHLYEHFTDNVSSSTAETGDYLILLDEYIQQFLIQASLRELVKENQFKLRSNGLSRRNTSPSSTSATDGQYAQKIDYIEEEMDFYGNKLVEYLTEAGSATFPELSMATDLKSDDPDLSKQYNRSPLVINRDKKYN